MNNLRDAEARIKQLERDLEAVKLQIKRTTTNGTTATSPKEIEKVSQAQFNIQKAVDSELTADGNTVLHKLYHIFNQLKINNLDVFDLHVLHDLDVDNNANIDNDLTVNNDLTVAELTTSKRVHVINNGIPSQFHISSDATAQGFYITNIAGSSYLSSGAYFDGVSWIAVNTSAMNIRYTGSGFDFNYNTGLTPGVAFALTRVFNISSAGAIHIPNLTASAYVMTTSGSVLTAVNAATLLAALNVYTQTQVDTLLAAKANTGTYTVTVNNNGNHSHSGAVPFDGTHSHTSSVTI